MGTYTAQIWVGQEHPNHAGLQPGFEQMFLSENSSPALPATIGRSW